MNKDILEGNGSKSEVRRKPGGANSPMMIWIAPQANSMCLQACFRKSMATPVKPLPMKSISA